MEQLRRVMFLVLFASVVATEPTHARTIAAEQANVPAPTSARWIQRLAVTLRRTAQTITLRVPARFDAIVRTLLAAPSQVTAAHATFTSHAFRLPPPG